MTESENTESSIEPTYHHVKMATLKDWLQNMEHEFFHMNVDSADSPSNTTSASSQQNTSSEYFEFSKDEEKHLSAASPADELFFEGKLLPLETVQKRRRNNKKNAAAATATAVATVTAAIDRVRSMSSIEDSSIPRSIDNADNRNIISPPHSRRFSSSDINVSECQLSESAADLTKRSWSLRWKHYNNTKQNKQSWLVQKLKASRTYIKSLFSNSASSEKDKSCSCPAAEDNNSVGSSAGKNKQPAPPKDQEQNAEHADADIEGLRSSAVANTISKSLHDDIGGGFGSTSGRRSSFSGVLKRHFSSKGSSLIMASATAANSSASFSLGCKELKSLKRSVSAAAHHHQHHHHDDEEKSVEGAIAHCKLSQQKGSNSHSS